MDEKNILFIAPRFHTNQFFLIKELVKDKNIKVHFLAVYSGNSENHTYVKPIISKPSFLTQWFFKKRNLEIAQDREIIGKNQITSISQCYEIYKKIKPNILIIRNLQRLISIQHILIGLLLRKKIILYTQNNYRQKISKSRSRLFKCLDHMGIKHFTPVYGNPEEPVIPNTEYVPFVIEPMVDRKSILSKAKTNGFQLITIGKMMKRKNILELILCLKRIHFFDSKKNRLLIVSECTSKENNDYFELIENNIKTIKEQIIFHLNVAHDNVFDLLRASDLFILPSHREQAAFSILEAMACGLAVICSDKNGTKAYIEENVNGLVFDYSIDLRDLERKITEILDKPTLVRFGLESLECIKKNHGIDNFYKKVIENKRA